ncbi:6888_t:CDS:2, partial [Gigaspora rosea]
INIEEEDNNSEEEDINSEKEYIDIEEEYIEIEEENINIEEENINIEEENINIEEENINIEENIDIEEVQQEEDSDINPNDKIKKYVDGKYVSASEAIWRLFKFDLHARSHTVYRLPVHLEGQQQVYFKDNSNIPAVLDKAQYTKLTRYFDLNANNPDNELLHGLRYKDIPNYYTWNKKTNNWQEENKVVKE